MALDLKGKQLEALCDALESAFPRWKDVDQLVEFELGSSLDSVATRGPTSAVVFELAKWARSQGRLEELVAGAVRRNPGNHALRRFAYEIALSSDAPPGPRLESIVLPDVPFASAAEWRARMEQAERCICRIEVPHGGGWRGIATAVLITADQVLTNDHVASQVTTAGGGRAHFDYAVDASGAERRGRTVDFAPGWLVKHSPASRLDYALVRLAAPVGAEPVEGAPRRGSLRPVRHAFTRGEPLLILQHPDADRLKIAVGALLDTAAEPPRVTYSANTRPGSSGAPAFSMRWDLVALHHAGEPHANRGIPLGAILDDLGWPDAPPPAIESTPATVTVTATVPPPPSKPALAPPPRPHRVTGPDVQPRRVFLSYHRHGEEAALATRIHEDLARRGHHVFIDTAMTVGTDWADAIRRNIAESDDFILLVSEASLGREMVQLEVREADRCLRAGGKPQIIPVRVRYDGHLDYEMDSYIGRLQYAMWRGPEDDATVLRELRRAMADGGSTDGVPAVPPPDRAPAIHDRPAPAVDGRLWFQPGGVVRLQDPLYLRRPGDELVATVAAVDGHSLMIKAPRQHGKTSLLARYVADCRARGKRIARIDFQTFHGADLESFAAFLQAFAVAICDAVGWDGKIPAIARQAQLGTFLVNRLLTPDAAPLVLALDEVDHVAGRAYKTDFFAMLRTWHNNRADEPEWNALDLALVISTEPEHLIDGGIQSPFNVAVPIRLDAFSAAQVRELNARYGEAALRPAWADEIYRYFGGHPYLTRLAFYLAQAGQLGFPLDVRAVASGDGPFGDHLRATLSRLSSVPALVAALRRIIAKQGAEPGQVDRLRSLGLVRVDGDGAPEPANLVYATFFRSV